MTLDKSWVHIRNRLSSEFENGLRAFIEHGKNYRNSEGNISCPCKNCKNGHMLPVNVIDGHIFQHEFDVTYTRWVFHGETFSIPSGTTLIVNELVDEMGAVLNDVGAAGAYEFGDVQTDEEDPQENEFTDLLSALQVELYPGCTKYSSLNFLAKLMHLKVLHKWSNECMDAVLKLLKDALPDDNKLPTSHYESKKLLSKLGLGYENIHACRYDCVLFWKENADLQECPICKTSRWSNKKGKKVPQKVLRYFPLKDRLKRLYTSRHTAKKMTWHQRGRSTDPNIMRHPVDGKEWKEFDEKYPDFACEPRNVRLGLAADSFNPFGNRILSYSLWPMVVNVYNLPPWLCTKDPYNFLTLLIPRPNAPGKDIDVYLRPLIDELQELWNEGIAVHDAASSTLFQMRAMLLMTVNDFPARTSLSGWSGQGYFACPLCNDATPSMRITNKVCYVGHRQWLPINHKMRNNKKFDNKVDKRHPPIRKSTQQILSQLQYVGFRLPGKHVKYGGKKRKRSTTELNWTKKSIFWKLPYWSSLSLHHNLDVMHIEKNVCESLFGTILNIEGKSKDTDKARIDLQNMGIHKELHLYKDGNRWMKPQAAYTLAPDDIKKFCDFLKHVRFPDGFASNLSKNVIEGNSKITGLKSHDCHIIMQRLLPTGIRPFMKKEIIDVIFELSNFFRLICSRTLRIDDLEKAQEAIVVILCKLETIFPPAFFDIMVHLVMHLPEEAIRGGPPQIRWMYPTERFLGKLKKNVRNRARPEGSIAEAYVVNEALTLCSMYLTGIGTKFNKPERNWVDVDENTDKLSVFKTCSRLIGKMTPVALENNMRNKAEWYKLQNCPKIRQYIDDHGKEMEQYYSTDLLNDRQSREFPKWFQKKMFSLHELKSPEATEQLVSLSFGSNFSVKSYPGCVVNDVKFLTHNRDISRTTQNSGVSVKGPNNEVYYGVLEEVYELTYRGNNSVIIFKCKWFNTSSKRRGMRNYKNKTSICIKDSWYEDEPFILASQAEQVFYLQDLFNSSDWRVVEHFGHRHIWDFPRVETDDVVVVQDIESSGIELCIELPDIMCNQPNVPSNVVKSNVDEIWRDKSHTHDDFINDDEDDILDEYIEDDNEDDDDDVDEDDDGDDDDINEGMRDINSDEE